MRSGSLRRYAMMTVAASTAVAVALSTTAAAPAPSASVQHHPVVTQTQIRGAPIGRPIDTAIGRPVKILGDGQVEGSSASFTYDFCLFHSSNYCLAMQSSADWPAIVLRSVKAANPLIEIWTTIFNPSNIEVQKVGGPSAGNGECVGAWGYNQRVHLGSCSSRHGVYWETSQPPTGGLYFYNTYSHGYLTTLCPCNGVTVWVHSLGKDWQNWFGYSY